VKVGQTKQKTPKVPYRPKIVAIGDSLTAGMQDANLVGERQHFSYPAQIARQAGLEFNQPLMDEAGIPPQLLLSPGVGTADTLWRYAQVGLASLPAFASLAFGFVPPEFVLWPLYHAGSMGSSSDSPKPVQNLAIPGFELRELNEVANVKDLMKGMANRSEGSGELVATGPYCRHILQDSKGSSHGDSQVNKAIAQNPDLVILWAGNNDALAAALQSDVSDRNLTPMEDQKWSYTSYNPITGKRTEGQTKTVQTGFRNSLVGEKGTLTRLLDETNAHVVLLNVPDVTTVPFLHKVGEKIGNLPFEIVLPGGLDITKKIENWTIPRSIKGKGIEGRDQFPEGTLVGLAMILSKLTHYFKVTDESQLDAALQAMAGEKAAFTEDEVLDPEELKTIQSRTKEFNQLLADQKSDRVSLVDANALLFEAAERGLALRGVGPKETVTNTFTGSRDERGFGGFFSADGVHPSDVGYAVIANRVMDSLRHDLQDDPRFESLVNAPCIDEKQVLKQDPHLGSRPRLVLTPSMVDRLFQLL